MWLGYGYLNSTEIWNNQRVMDYLLGDPANGRAGLALPTQTITNWDGCGTSNRLFCDPPLEVDGWRYTTPADDDAPWYDGSGSVRPGNFSTFLDHANFPPSTIAPATTVP